VNKSPALAETDSLGIPTAPTWSVNELLSSYPKPTISPATVNKLHRLSALIPPGEGTPEYATLTTEMEDLIKLVEAVRLVDVPMEPASDNAERAVPDGRLWEEGVGIKLEEPQPEMEDVENGTALLKHAARTARGLYVVESDRVKRA
jgi:hypothetical protein